jgi:hypothetical protein
VLRFALARKRRRLPGSLASARWRRGVAPFQLSLRESSFVQMASSSHSPVEPASSHSSSTSAAPRRGEHRRRHNCQAQFQVSHIHLARSAIPRRSCALRRGFQSRPCLIAASRAAESRRVRGNSSSPAMESILHPLDLALQRRTRSRPSTNLIAVARCRKEHATRCAFLCACGSSLRSKATAWPIVTDEPGRHCGNDARAAKLCPRSSPVVRGIPNVTGQPGRSLSSAAAQRWM